MHRWPPLRWSGTGDSWASRPGAEVRLFSSLARTYALGLAGDRELADLRTNATYGAAVRARLEQVLAAAPDGSPK